MVVTVAAMPAWQSEAIHSTSVRTLWSPICADRVLAEAMAVVIRRATPATWVARCGSTSLPARYMFVRSALISSFSQSLYVICSHIPRFACGRPTRCGPARNRTPG